MYKDESYLRLFDEMKQQEEVNNIIKFIKNNRNINAMY